MEKIDDVFKEIMTINISLFLIAISIMLFSSENDNFEIIHMFSFYLVLTVFAVMLITIVVLVFYALYLSITWLLP